MSLPEVAVIFLLLFVITKAGESWLTAEGKSIKLLQAILYGVIFLVYATILAFKIEPPIRFDAVVILLLMVALILQGVLESKNKISKFLTMLYYATPILLLLEKYLWG